MANSNSVTNNHSSSSPKNQIADKASHDLSELEMRIRQLSSELKNNQKQRSPDQATLHTSPEKPMTSTLTDEKATLAAIASQLRSLETESFVDTQSLPKEPSKAPIYNIDVLTENLTEMHKLVQTLAREDTVRRMAHRWDSFDEQLENLADRQEDKLNQLQPSVISIGQRLDELYTIINGLHKQLDIHQHPLTERFDKLTHLVAQLIELHLHSDAQKLEPVLHQLDERLAEIQKNVISPSSAITDNNRLNQIDQRLSELCQQVAAVLQSQDNHDLAEQIQQINQRLDLLNQKHEEPAKQLEKLLQPMNQLADLATRSNNEVRGEDLALINRRFDDLLARFDTYGSHPVEPAQHMEVLEARLGVITEQLKSDQIVAPVLSALTPRFDQFEASLTQTRESVLETARMVAEQTITRMMESGHLADNDTVQQLSKDMEMLEVFSKRTEMLNSEALGNVHQTLVKIADRLTKLENNEKPVSVKRQPVESTIAPLVKTLPKVDLDKDFFNPNLAMPDTSLTPKQPAIAPLSAPTAEKKEATNKSKVEIPPAALKVALPDQQETQLSATMPDVNAILRRVRADQPQSSKTTARTQQDSASWPARRFKSSIDKNNIDTAEIRGSKEVKQSSLNLVINRHRRSMMVGACVLAAMTTGYFYAPKIERQVTALWSQIQTQVQHAELSSIDTETIVGSINPVITEDPAFSTIVVTPPEATTSTPKDNSVMVSVPNTEDFTSLSLPDTDMVTPLPVSTDTVTTDTAKQPALELTAIPAITEEVGPVPLREAAAQGNADALFEIGNRYLDGRGVAADQTQAAKWYQLSAERGQPLAQYRLGSLYEKGSGIERSITKAQELYEKSAIQGNANAMHNLAVILASGASGQADNISAMNWFEKAAELGVLDSQYNLGIFNAKGIGTPVNLEEAYKWFALAAMNGDEDAKQKTQEIATTLPADKIERAKATVELWKPKAPEASANYVNIPEDWDDQKPTSLTAADMKKAIQNVQIMLQNAGYNAGNPDGIMGNKTREAILTFQKDNNLNPHGEIDESFVKLLLSKNS